MLHHHCLGKRHGMCESKDCDCPCHRGEKVYDAHLDDATFRRIKHDVLAEDGISIMENCVLDVPLLVRALDHYKNDQLLRAQQLLVDSVRRFFDASDDSDTTEKERALGWMKKRVEEIQKITAQRKLSGQ